MSSSHYTEMTIYTWDEAKRQSNLRKHGLDFADASVVFKGAVLVEDDLRFHFGERRFNTLGYFQGEEVSITHTERHNGIRIISFRKATRKERIELFRATR
jgi:uncharacterized DUF497 family protein